MFYHCPLLTRGALWLRRTLRQNDQRQDRRGYPKRYIGRKAAARRAVTHARQAEAIKL